MRYACVVTGTMALIAVILFTRLKLEWVDGVGAQVAELCLWAVAALALSKTLLQNRVGGTRPLFRFRELVITVSIVFTTICANVGIQSAQVQIFGKTYRASYADPVPQPGAAEVPSPRTVPEKLAEMAASVSAEEISSRWIILGALLMLMSPGRALLLSSLLFAMQHAIVPIVGGVPEVGLFHLAPTFAIGIGCGIAFLRSGLTAAILVHFLVNMVGLSADNNTQIADTVIFDSAFVALVVLPGTLWFTRKRRPSACYV